MKFRLGLIVNPLAGVGGSVALKGSDGSDTVAQALALGATPQAGQRALQALAPLTGLDVRLLTWGGAMGEQVALEAGLVPEVLGRPQSEPSTAEDTERRRKRWPRPGLI